MAWDFCNLRAAHWARYSVPSRPQSALFQMMNSLTRGFSRVALHWRTSAVIACAAVGMAVTTRRCLETDEARMELLYGGEGAILFATCDDANSAIPQSGSG